VWEGTLCDVNVWTGTEYKKSDSRVNEQQQQVKDMTETSKNINEKSKGLGRHNQKWWWNDEVAEAVKAKKDTLQTSGKERIKRGKV